ncbi:MAG: sulfotransferase domain-containing protein [Pirellulales bacterium]
MGSQKDLTFIVSGGRTGTQFFGDLLSDVIDDCYSVHEPDVYAGLNSKSFQRIKAFGIWHILVGRALALTGSRVIGQRFIYGRISPERVQAYIGASRNRYYQRIPESLVVESNNQWWALIDQISVVWPHAKVITIIRDPRDWVRSWIHKKGRYDKHDWVSCIPPGRLTPEKVGDTKWAKRWSEFDTFGRLTWEWRFLYGKINASVERVPQAQMFRFEDIFKTDGDALRELVLFAATHGDRIYSIKDLDSMTQTKLNSSDGQVPHWRLWTPAQARLMDEICGSLMQRFGYGLEPEWQALI